MSPEVARVGGGGGGAGGGAGGGFGIAFGGDGGATYKQARRGLRSKSVCSSSWMRREAHRRLFKALELRNCTAHLLEFHLLRLQALEHVRSIHSECAGYGGTTVNQGCEECSALVGGRGSAWREGTPLAFARTLMHVRARARESLPRDVKVTFTPRFNQVVKQWRELNIAPHHTTRLDTYSERVHVPTLVGWAWCEFKICCNKSLAGRQDCGARDDAIKPAGSP